MPPTVAACSTISDTRPTISHCDGPSLGREEYDFELTFGEEGWTCCVCFLSIGAFSKLNDENMDGEDDSAAELRGTFPWTCAICKTRSWIRYRSSGLVDVPL